MKTDMNGISSSPKRAAPKSAESAVKITAVICTHNRYDVLPDAISSLQSQAMDANALEILVIDNSTDHAAQENFWKNYGLPSNARLIVDKVPGLSRARNTALREARAPIIAYIDDDAVAMAGWADAIATVFDTHEKAGIAGGPVEPIWPSEAPKWLHKWQRGFLTIVDHGKEARALETREWLAGTNIAFRTSVLREVGGFNESLGRVGSSLLSNEELVISEKIKEKGFGAYYTPDARVMHRVHADRVTQQWLRKRIGWQAVSDQLAASSDTTADRCWSEIAEYLSTLPPEMRGIRSLFLDTQDPEMFYMQCRALEALMHLALHHAKDPER
jgi:glycosyltransferase involved in cell wall biosynthesis